MWTFKVFINSSRRDKIEEWIARQDVVAEGKIRARIRQLSMLNKTSWGSSFANLKLTPK